MMPNHSLERTGDPVKPSQAGWTTGRTVRRDLAAKIYDMGGRKESDRNTPAAQLKTVSHLLRL